MKGYIRSVSNSILLGCICAYMSITLSILCTDHNECDVMPNLPIIHYPLWLSYRSSGVLGHLHFFRIHKMLLHGSVHAICKRILMLGYSCASHSLMASDGELGSLSAGTVLSLDFHLHISFSNSSGVGRS